MPRRNKQALELASSSGSDLEKDYLADEKATESDKVIQISLHQRKHNWTKAQQRFLVVLQQSENHHKTVSELCQLVGYHSTRPWCQALQDEQFVAAVEQLTGIVLHGAFSKGQQRILKVLQQEEHSRKTIIEICALAGLSTTTWTRAMQKPAFVKAVEALGIRTRQPLEAHIHVVLSQHPEEELAKDIWDIRRLRSDYPKHVNPSAFRVNFSWIKNVILREQIKLYFRQHLPQWKPGTVKGFMTRVKPFLESLPFDVDMGSVNRKHIEDVLPRIWQRGNGAAVADLRATRTMLEYMALSASWPGPRPPRNLIWRGDIPPRPLTLPRPIPPDVLDQLDPLLEQAVEAMKQGQSTAILTPILWDAILILRHTGMRFEDIAHLKAPNAQDRNGCLDQDSDGYWWVRIHHSITKMNKDHRIPTKLSDGVVDAIRRQCQRITNTPDHFQENYLFRTDEGVLSYYIFFQAMRRLASHLTYEGHPYQIAPHQYRHTMATDMIEMGVDIYTVKEFLGHASLTMTERYVKVYLTSLKAKYDAYRLKKQQTYASEMMVNQVQVTQPENETDGGWVDGKVGKLYISPLPDGLGNCAHLPMHDGCPDSPHCPTCPKLRANKRHLPVWESRTRNLLITVEALKANPAYARARQKHEQELRHSEKVIETIQREGFWDGRIHNSETHTH